MTKPDATLPTIVGANARRLPGDRGDQRVYGDDGTLVIHASALIEGAVVSDHRPTLVVVDDVRWKLVRYERTGDKKRTTHLYTLAPWEPGPFEREGQIVDYDPDRVHKARVERASVWARTALLLLLLPVVPFFGFLPEKQRERLREQGLYPTGTMAGSLFFEWALLLLVTVAELMLVMAGAPLSAMLCGFFALMILVDIPHRIVLLAEDRDAGMFVWVGDIVRALKEKPPADDPPHQLPPPEA